MAVKWIFKSKFNLCDNKFARIYRFFVIETPVDGVSARGVSFKSKGINMNSLNSCIKRETPFMKHSWFVEKVSNIEERCKSEKIFNEVDGLREIAIHSKNDKLCSGNTDSLYYAIRCAFAHGSFGIHNKDGEKYYMLENKDNNKIKARIIVKEETLIKWIEMVELGATSKKVK